MSSDATNMSTTKTTDEHVAVIIFSFRVTHNIKKIFLFSLAGHVGWIHTHHVPSAGLKTLRQLESAAVISVCCGAEITKCAARVGRAGSRVSQDRCNQAFLTWTHLFGTSSRASCKLLSRTVQRDDCWASARDQTRGVSSNRLPVPCVKSPSLERVADFGNSSLHAPPMIRKKRKTCAAAL